MPLEGRQNVRQAKGAAAKKSARQNNAALRRGAGLSVRRPGKGNTMAQTGGEKGKSSGYSKFAKPPMRGGASTRPKTNVGGKPASQGRRPGGMQGGRGRRPGGRGPASHPFQAGTHRGFRGPTGGNPGGYGQRPGGQFPQMAGLAGQFPQMTAGPLTGGYGGAPGPQPGSATGGNPFQNMGNPFSNIMNPSQAMNGLGGMLGGKGGGGQASMRQGMNGGQRQAAGNPQNRMY